MIQLPPVFAVCRSQERECWFAVARRAGQGSTLERLELTAADCDALTVEADDAPIVPLLASRDQ